MTRIRLLLHAVAIALFVGLSAGPMHSAHAGMLDPYEAKGWVGEKPDGFAGLVTSDVPADVKAKVADVNAKRRAEYAKIASKEGTSVQAVGAVFGKKLIARAPSGAYVMNSSGQWVKKP